MTLMYCAEAVFPGDGEHINYFGKDVTVEDLEVADEDNE